MSQFWGAVRWLGNVCPRFPSLACLGFLLATESLGFEKTVDDSGNNDHQGYENHTNNQPQTIGYRTRHEHIVHENTGTNCNRANSANMPPRKEIERANNETDYREKPVSLLL